MIDRIKKISLNEIELPSKVTKRINVRSYMTHEGKQVGPYNRTQLINLKKVKSNSTYKNLDDFLVAAKDAKERYNANPSNETFQKEILGLYQDGEHTIWDTGFDKDTGYLGKVYEAGSNLFSQILPHTELNRDQVFDLLTNPDKIKERHQKSLTLEKFFNNDLKMETERTNLFSFKTKLNLNELDADQMAEAIYEQSKKMMTKLTHDIRDKMNISKLKPNQDIFDWASSMTGELINKTELSERDISSKILSPLLTSSVLGIKDNRRETGAAFLQTLDVLNPEVVKRLKEKLPEDFHSMDVLLGDPQNIKTTMLKTLKTLKSDTPEFDVHVKNMSDKISGMDMKQALHQFTFMMENGHFSKLLNDKDLINSFDNFSKRMVDSGINEIKARDGYAHFTNNPMEILTMSPEGKITSCQSITKDGKLGVNSFNYNLLSSLHKPNDFISVIPSPNDSKVKRERMSLHFSEKDKSLINYESCVIYSQDNVHENIQDFIFDNPSNRRLGNVVKSGEPADELLEMVHEIDIAERPDKAYGTHHENIQTLSDFMDKMDEEFVDLKSKSDGAAVQEKWFEEKSKGYNELTKKIKSSDKAIKDLKKEIESEMTQAIVESIKTSPSFFYGSRANIGIDWLTCDKPHEMTENVLSGEDDNKLDIDNTFQSLEETYEELSTKYHNVHKHRFGS